MTSSSYDFAAAGRRGAKARKTFSGGWTKGKRRHSLTLPEREYRSLLADIMSSIREPEPGHRSLRAVAKHCGVDPRTVGRWLDGTDIAPAPMVRRLESWRRSVAQPAS